jgi:hypothetical protein
MRDPFSKQHGSTLLLSISCIAGLAIAAALTLQRISPRFQMTAQAAAWQEARLSAEAGIDVALLELEQNNVGFNQGKWNGWYQYDGGTPPPTLLGVGSVVPLPPAAGKGKGKPSPADKAAKDAAKAAKKAKKQGKAIPAVPETLSLVNSRCSERVRHSPPMTRCPWICITGK